MGVNNRQRRAAKKRRRDGAARSESRPDGGRHDGGRPDGQWGADARAAVLGLVREAVLAVAQDPGSAEHWATVLAGPATPVPPFLLSSAAAVTADELVAAATGGGWSPGDLLEVTRRRLTTRHVPLLAGLLGALADRYPADRVASAWREELEQLGPRQAHGAATPEGLQPVLELCAVLAGLPPVATLVPPPGAAWRTHPTSAGADPKLLARVRGLLAKAESTEFPDEAEALSAKAQELMSRHALDRLVDEVDGNAPTEPVGATRLWIDAPYVLAKAMLVDAVASANRCRTVVAEQLGFTTVIGQRADLAAVELLTTSLLVQADTAMLRHGRQADLRGTSRTASFRRSFLISYAGRIRERLHAAEEEAFGAGGRTGALVPVLQRRAERVEAATAELFPHVVPRGTSISNPHGWAAGRVAADLASLTTAPEVRPATG